MISHRLRMAFPVLIAAFLPLSGCKQRAPVSQAAQTSNDSHRAPAGPPTYKVYQGSGNIGEETGGRVCFVYDKDEHCWNAGDGFSEVTAKPIKLSSGSRLIIVSALSMGGSDGTTDLALLREQNQQPVNLLPSAEITSANSGQWDSWQIEKLSPMPIILTANTVWSNDVNVSNANDRARAHQFEITAYTYDATTARYIPKVDYLTSRKYPGGKDVIALEKQTILAGLKGVSTP